MVALGLSLRHSSSSCFRTIVFLVLILTAFRAHATAPTISSFSPASGVIGATVTITGANFSATKTNDAVKFNGTAATVSSATTTQLVVTVPSGATTGTITVTVSSQTGTSSTSFVVTPAITSFSPAGGAPAVSVTIHGTGFSSTASQDVVKFSGVTATVTAATTTQLTATVPSGISTGPITVTVGGNTATSNTNFVITPVVTSFTPTSGPVATAVTFTGTNFDPTAANNTLKFHGTVATVTSASTTQLVASVPSGATSGTVSVTVGGQTGTSSGSFTVTVPPTITGFSPTSGVPNTSVTISGTNFSTTKANDIVKFNGVSASVTSATSSQLVAKVPSGATSGPISVTVTTTGLSASSGSNFTVPVPTITQFVPSGGPVGTTVTITGSNFDPTPANNLVNFNNLNGHFATVSAASATQLSVSVNYGATTGPICVTTAGLTGCSSLSFTIPAPTISAVNPTTAAVGTTVTITGSNFDPSPSNNAVSFNDTYGSVISASSTQLTIAVPANATSGPLCVSVQGGTPACVSFTVGIPAVSSFSPPSGAVGTVVTIVGANFNSTTTNNIVFWEGDGLSGDQEEGTYPTSASATQLVATVPSGSTTGQLCVKVSGYAAKACAPANFLVAGPVVTSFSPASGVVGDAITITGSGFSPNGSANGVKFGGQQIAGSDLVSASATQLVVKVPKFAVPGPICVYYGTQGCSTSNFNVILPTITSFTPTTAPVGSTVTITGTNFSTTPANNSVLIANEFIATVNSATATQLVVTPVFDTVTGPICVSVNYSAPGCSSTNFTVPLATISGFSPGSGSGGTTVTINGTNFSPAPSYNHVTFNGTYATVLSQTTTQLTAAVPNGATTGALCVIVGSANPICGASFTVPVPTITGFTPTSGVVGTTVTLTGTNFAPTLANDILTLNGRTVSITAATATQLTATIPYPGTSGPFCVTNDGGTPGCSSTNFTVLATTPTISSIVPTSGPVGSSVIVNGTNFSPVSTYNAVTFNGKPAGVVSSTSTQLNVTVPIGDTTGPVAVVVGGVSGSSTATFTVSTPTISSIVPASGQVGSTVIVNGTNFSPVFTYNAVTFNGTPAAVFSSTLTQMKVTVPFGATTGTVAVVVGGFSGSSAAPFTVTPLIEGFDPSQGPTGTTVTIAGNGFDPVAANDVITLGGTNVPVSSAMSDQLVFVVPPGASSGKISVSVDGQPPQLSAAPFEVLPQIFAFIPASGPVSTTVTINGTGFSTTPAANFVTFNGAIATVTAATSTSLQVSVPSAAQTGPIFVSIAGESAVSEDNFTVTGGSSGLVTVYGYDAMGRLTQVGSAIGASQYSYDALGNLVSVTSLPANQLAVFSVAPGQGAAGDSVTINGQGFNTTPANNVINFNGSAATVLFSSATQIVAVVPSGATTGTVSVTVGANTQTSGTSFIVNP